MKIRTDFVTNSSSSSFSISLYIETKNGEVYSFEAGDTCEDEGTTWYFNANLESLLLSTVVNNIKKNSGKKFKLCNRGSDEQNAQNVSVGDQLTLVKIARNSVGYAVDVRNNEGSLGTLSRGAVRFIKDALESDAIELKAIVHSVTKKTIFISFNAEKKNPEQMLTIDDVHDLAQFLMDAVSDSDSDWWDIEETDSESDWWGIEETDSEPDWDKEKEKFVANVVRNISSINDIAEISVYREYSAWGECADLIPDWDDELCELAKKVLSASEDDQEKALDEMLAYIRTPSPNRGGETFGHGCDVSYNWDGDKEALLTLAKRLCSDQSAGISEGREHHTIDLIRDVAVSEADFDLC